MSKPQDVIELFHKAGPLFVALGDENRQHIVVQLLQIHKMSVNQITESTPLSRPAVSHHLKLLHQAGLVDIEKQGTQRLYYLADSSIEQVDLLEMLARALRECTNWQTPQN
ncbi:MAG: ArsR/SmtB family transcription factor [Candidatus Saccharibacteria bacterium]